MLCEAFEKGETQHMVTMVHTSCNYGVQNLKQYQVPSSTDVMSTSDVKRRKVDKDNVGNR